MENNGVLGLAEDAAFCGALLFDEGAERFTGIDATRLCLPGFLESPIAPSD